MLKKKTKYVQEFEKESKILSNRDLLYEILNMAGGDDYDGCWTERGWIEYTVYITELENRLKNWLEIKS